MILFNFDSSHQCKKMVVFSNLTLIFLHKFEISLPKRNKPNLPSIHVAAQFVKKLLLVQLRIFQQTLENIHVFFLLVVAFIYSFELNEQIQEIHLFPDVKVLFIEEHIGDNVQELVGEARKAIQTKNNFPPHRLVPMPAFGQGLPEMIYNRQGFLVVQMGDVSKAKTINGIYNVVILELFDIHFGKLLNTNSVIVQVLRNMKVFIVSSQSSHYPQVCHVSEFVHHQQWEKLVHCCETFNCFGACLLVFLHFLMVIIECCRTNKHEIIN